MHLKPGTMYRCLVDVPLWAKENHLDTGEGELFRERNPLTHRSINAIEAGDSFMYIAQSMRQPFTYKVLYEDQAGWVFFGMASIEHCVQEISPDDYTD